MRWNGRQINTPSIGLVMFRAMVQITTVWNIDKLDIMHTP